MWSIASVKDETKVWSDNRANKKSCYVWRETGRVAGRGRRGSSGLYRSTSRAGRQLWSRWANLMPARQSVAVPTNNWCRALGVDLQRSRFSRRGLDALAWLASGLPGLPERPQRPCGGLNCLLFRARPLLLKTSTAPPRWLCCPQLTASGAS